MEFKNKNKLVEQRYPKPLRNRKTAKETTEKKKDGMKDQINFLSKQGKNQSF